MEMMNELEEYLELIEEENLERLYKVFKIVYDEVDFNTRNINIYNFTIDYYKEIRVLIEMGIIEIDVTGESSNDYDISTKITQLEIEKVKELFETYRNDDDGYYNW